MIDFFAISCVYFYTQTLSLLYLNNLNLDASNTPIRQTVSSLLLLFLCEPSNKSSSIVMMKCGDIAKKIIQTIIPI